MTAHELPPSLGEIRDAFLSLSTPDRLQLLLEFSDDLPELPEQYRDHPDLFERVEECQAPVFVFAEVDAEHLVRLFITAPVEAPTTRGFASVLMHGLTGVHVDDALAVPDDFPAQLGLTAAISPLRVRGMSALLWRAKRQIESSARALTL